MTHNRLYVVNPPRAVRAADRAIRHHGCMQPIMHDVRRSDATEIALGDFQPLVVQKVVNLDLNNQRIYILKVGSYFEVFEK